MPKLLDAGCDDVFVAYPQRWVMHVRRNRRASTLIDAVAGTLPALDLKEQMENTDAEDMLQVCRTSGGMELITVLIIINITFLLSMAADHIC